MKKQIVALTIASMSLLTSAQSPEWIHLGRYEAANKELQALPNNGNRVIFLGNSITEGWVNLHPEFFKAHPNFYGRGIGGETTSQFLSRFRDDVINNNPALVIINGGTNDIAGNTGPYNPELTFGNIVSMVELAKANSIKVILTSVLPVYSYPWSPAVENVPEKIKALNNRIKNYASKNKIMYVDYYTPMATETLALNPDYSNDGVHPTPAGYDVMEEIILKAIKKAGIKY